MLRADGAGEPTRRAALEVRALTKTFGGVTALDGVSLSVERGECHALVGENGAGKSTLGKVLAGIHRPDRGIVFIDGQMQAFNSPADAARAGVGMVHQEPVFCRDLSVAENLCLGRYPRRLGLFYSRRGARVRAEALLARIGAQLDVGQPMRRLATAQEQLVQIAAAIGTGARVLVFDEPTSSLSETESQRLFALIGSLRGRGVTSIYISHRLPEIFQLADRISVLRDGRLVGTVARAQASEAELVQMMIGRPLAEYFPQHLAARCWRSKTCHRRAGSAAFRCKSAPARSSVWRDWSGRAAARSRARSSAWTVAPAGRYGSTGEPCGSVQSGGPCAPA